MTAAYLLRWSLLASAVGALAGSASAAFLVSLDAATAAREAHPWIIYLLPAGGMLVGLLYHALGKEVEGGNNLILDEIHEPKSGVPVRIAPLVLLATVLTHLVGGSAGREGTAVQMGGGLAAGLGRLLRLKDVRVLLMCGISGGFGAVFGTPIAGMVFGLEVLTVGRLRTDAVFPCLVASLVGDGACAAWGVKHAHYHPPEAPALSPAVVAAVVLMAACFGLAARAFTGLTHAISHEFKRVKWAPLRPATGGVVLLLLVWAAGTRDYLGLSLPLLAASVGGSVPAAAFAWKLGFTALTLGSGFKGGEVTPLFVIGATLGHALGVLLGLPPGFAAALGFAAVFGAAANTPLACLVMGIELFGAGYGVPLALACVVAVVVSGEGGIYEAQRREPVTATPPGPPA
ncbi:MAG: chloride channel protein [Gemmataceae bacterium]